MKKYILRDREAGNFIEEVTTYEEAKAILEEWEREDKEEGEFIPNFYELVEMELKDGKWEVNFTETYEGVL